MGAIDALKTTFSDSKATSFLSAGDIIASMKLDTAATVGKDDDGQRRDIFSKKHILDISHNEFDPQREFMFQVYIQDIPGRYWVDMVNNYPSFIRRLVDLGYGLVSGGITTAAVLGMVNLVRNLGQTGSSSPQQSLVYRTNSVKLPSRSTISKPCNFMGKRSNIITGTQYEGTLSINFTETEDLFILRQFTSWLNIEDENAILGTNMTDDIRKSAETLNTIDTALAKAMADKSGIGKLKALRGDGGAARINAQLQLNLDDNNKSTGVQLNKSFIPMTRAMKTEIQLLMYRYNGDDVGYKITYYGCYPKSIGGANFTYESGSGTISYDVEFDYDHYHIEYIDEPEKLNPTNNFRSTMAKFIDTMLNIGIRSLMAYIRRLAIAERSDAMFENAAMRPVPRGTILDDNSKHNFRDGVALGDINLTPKPSPDNYMSASGSLVVDDNGDLVLDEDGNKITHTEKNFRIGVTGSEDVFTSPISVTRILDNVKAKLFVAETIVSPKIINDSSATENKLSIEDAKDFVAESVITSASIKELRTKMQAKIAVAKINPAAMPPEDNVENPHTINRFERG